MQIVAIIPARGGSKRVPRKNIRPFHGKPIIAYTIEAALQSSLFSRIIVSTDDQEIAEIAQLYGAEVPFLRQANIADDHTPVSEVTSDALLRLDPDGQCFEAVAQLMANCPLRTAVDIRSSYDQFVQTGTDAQISVTRYGWLNPWWAMEMNANHQLAPFFTEQLKARSQDLPELFCPTGAIWWIKASALRASKTFHISGRTGWQIPWQRAVDIDDEADWLLAESLYLKS